MLSNTNEEKSQVDFAFCNFLESQYWKLDKNVGCKRKKNDNKPDCLEHFFFIFFFRDLLLKENNLHIFCYFLWVIFAKGNYVEGIIFWVLY